MTKVRVTLKKSTINRKEVHGRTVRALGLRKLHQTVEHELTPQVQGMIDSVSFLLNVEEVK